MSSREQSRSRVYNPIVLADNTIIINPEAVKLIVNKHFNRISAAEWSLLAEGFCAPGVDTMLTDMLCEMTQTLSWSVISTVLPLFLSKDSRRDWARTLDSLNMHLGDTLAGAYAEALHLPEDKCKSVERLTELIERQVSLKVKSALTLAVSSPTLPEEPAVFVSGSVPITSLRHMLALASLYLKRCVTKLRFKCLGCCSLPNSSGCTAESLEPSVRREVPQSLKSRVSVLSVTQEVASILGKWSSEMAEIREDSDSCSDTSSPSVHAYDAAFDIVGIISNDLHYSDHGHDESSESNRTSKPHFSMGLILKIVKGLFASEAGVNAHESNKKQRKSRFLKFAKMQFEKMRSELERSTQKSEPGFTVPLSRPSQATLKKEDSPSEDLNLPGADPKSPRPKSEAVRKKLHSSLEFEEIKNVVEIMYKMLNLTRKPVEQQKIVGKLDSMMRQFSKDLTDKLYDHLITSNNCDVPSAPTGRSTSEYVISTVRRTANQCCLSPEVIYAITEDLVGRFLQQILLWMDKEQTNLISFSEEVSGALSNIEDLITKTVTSEEENKVTAPQCPGATDRQPSTSCCSTPVEPFNDPADNDDETLRNTVDETSVTENTGSSESSLISERSTDNIIVPLVLRILTKAITKSKFSYQEADINTIIKRLSDKAEAEVRFDDGAPKKNRVNMRKVNKAVIKDLEKEFGSPKLILEAALASNDPSFDDAAVRYVKFHLDALNSPTPKKSGISRFFSRVGEAVSKAFRCCTDEHTSSDSDSDRDSNSNSNSDSDSDSERSSQTITPDLK